MTDEGREEVVPLLSSPRASTSPEGRKRPPALQNQLLDASDPHAKLHDAELPMAASNTGSYSGFVGSARLQKISSARINRSNTKQCTDMSVLSKLHSEEYLEEHYPHLDADEVSRAAEELDKVAEISEGQADIVNKQFKGMKLEEFRKAMMFKRRPVETCTILHFAIWFVSEMGVDPDLILHVLECLDNADDAFFPATYKAGPKTVFVNAVHLAAGLGQMPILQILLKHACTEMSEGLRFEAYEYVNQWTLMTPPNSTATAADFMDPSKRSEYKNFYQPIHDSTFAGYGDVTVWLLQHKAECTRNYQQITPLHFIAFSGISGCLDRAVGDDLKKIVRELCHSNTQVQNPLSATCNMKNFIPDSPPLNPLQIAVEDASRYPQEHLGLLAPCIHDVSGNMYFADIKTIADVTPEGALNLVKSIAESGKRNQNILRRFRINAQSSGSSDILASVFYTAPLAASEMLELLEAQPEVEDAAHHSIPARTSLWGLLGVNRMRCTYQTDAISKDRLLLPYWEWKTRTVEKGKQEERNNNNWHDDFVPRPPRQARTASIMNVRVVTCLLPNILDIDILMALAVVQQGYLATMANKTVQGTIMCLWDNLVEWQWAMDVFFRFLEAAAYISLAIIIPAEEARLSLAWTIVAGMALHQGIMFITTNINTVRKWANQRGEDSTLANMWHPFSSRATTWNIIVISQVCLAILYAIDLSFHDHERTQFDDRLLAVCLLMSCFRFIWAWRLSDAGSTIYTIKDTLFAGPGNQMLFITWMLLASFVIALMVLSRLHTAGLAVYTYRGFLFGDGDGFNDIGMDLGHEHAFGGAQADAYMLGFALFGAFFFNVVVLNIIIAIYGHEYEKSQTDTPLKYMQGRADFCVKSVLSSYIIPWQGETMHWALYVVALCIITLSLLLSASREHVEFWHMWLSAVLLAAGMSLMRMAMMQCAWFSPEGEDSEENQRFLWICHTRDWSRVNMEAGMEDRVQVMHEELESQIGSMESQMHRMDGKIDQIFSALQLHDHSRTPSKGQISVRKNTKMSSPGGMISTRTD